jgi:hypothetical protein
MKNNSRDKQSSISVIATVIAALALGLSIINTMHAHYRPMAMSIEVLGFSGPEKDVSNSIVAANIVFSNLGKRNVAIAGTFLKVINPADSTNLYSYNWTNRDSKEKAMPSIVPAEQTLLKTIYFDGPQVYELEGMATINKAKEIECIMIVTVVDKHGELGDIYFNSVRFLIDSKGKYSGYIFDSKSSVATLKDIKKETSILKMLPGSSVSY